jgi:hypothetical protein
MTRSIPTPASLRQHAYRLDRRAASLNTALNAMRRGELLYLEYRAGKPHWALTDGHTIDPKVAESLTRNAAIKPVSAALFDCVPAQTWRYQ